MTASMSKHCYSLAFCRVCAPPVTLISFFPSLASSRHPLCSCLTSSKIINIMNKECTHTGAHLLIYSYRRIQNVIKSSPATRSPIVVVIGIGICSTDLRLDTEASVIPVSRCGSGGGIDQSRSYVQAAIGPLGGSGVGVELAGGGGNALAAAPEFLSL